MRKALIFGIAILILITLVSSSTEIGYIGNFTQDKWNTSNSLETITFTGGDNYTYYFSIPKFSQISSSLIWINTSNSLQNFSLDVNGTNIALSTLNPLADYLMLSSANKLLDSSSYNNDLVEQNTPDYRYINSTLSWFDFDSSDYLNSSTSLPAGTVNVTYSLWFNWTGAISGSPPMFYHRKGGDTSQGAFINFYDTGDKLRYGLETGNSVTQQEIDASSYRDGVFHHAAMTWDGVTIRLYMDNISISNLSKGGTLELNELHIGSNRDVDAFYTQGGIASFTIYNDTLTHQQVSELYTNGMKRNYLIDLNVIEGNKNFNGTKNISNFADEIEAQLDNCSKNINGYCDIPVIFHSDTAGTLQADIGNSINYSVQYNFSFNNETIERSLNNYTLYVYTNDSINTTFYYNNTAYSTSSSYSAGIWTFVHNNLRPPWVTDPSNQSFETYWEINDFTQLSNTSKHNQTVFRLYINNESTCGAVPLNFTTVDETTETALNTDVQALFILWYDSEDYRRNYTFDFGGKSNYPFCTSPSWVNYSSDFEIKFSATNYDDRYYRGNDVLLNNSWQNITIYMTNSTLSTQITITTVDENDNELVGYTVEAYKYDLGTNNYTLMDSRETNSEGKAIFNLDVSSDEYMFQVKNPNGVLVHTEPKSLLTETAYTLRVVLGAIPESILIKLQNLDYNLSVDRTHNNFTLIWDDGSSIINDINLTVVRTNTTAKDYLYSIISTADSGTLNYNVSGNGIYVAYAYVTSTDDGITYLLDTVTLDIREEWDIFGTDSLIMALLFVGTMFFVGLAIGPEVAIILTILGMFLFFVLGFIAVGLSGLISICISWAIIAMEIKKR